LLFTFILTLAGIIEPSTIDPNTHIASFMFCPFIFGGMAIFAIVKWAKLEKGKTREVVWSILNIILMVLVLTFVGLNTFLWLNDLMFYIFIGVRFSLLIFLAILANPYIKWAPFKKLFVTPVPEE